MLDVSELESCVEFVKFDDERFFIAMRRAATGDDDDDETRSPLDTSASSTADRCSCGDDDCAGFCCASPSVDVRSRERNCDRLMRPERAVRRLLELLSVLGSAALSTAITRRPFVGDADVERELRGSRRLRELIRMLSSLICKIAKQRKTTRQRRMIERIEKHTKKSFSLGWLVWNFNSCSAFLRILSLTRSSEARRTVATLASTLP